MYRKQKQFIDRDEKKQDTSKSTLMCYRCEEQDHVAREDHKFFRMIEKGGKTIQEKRRASKTIKEVAFIRIVSQATESLKMVIIAVNKRK